MEHTRRFCLTCIFAALAQKAISIQDICLPRFSCGRGDPLLCGLDACRLKDVFVSFCCYATMAWVSSDYRDHLGRAGAGVDPWRDGDYVRLKRGRRNEYYPDTLDESDSDADY